MLSRIALFQKAIENEISIDKDVLDRLGVTSLGFVPVRPLKTLRFIEKYRVGSGLYFVAAIFFQLAFPLYCFFVMLKRIRASSRHARRGVERNLVLVANGRIEFLFSKLNAGGNVSFLNINQGPREGRVEFCGVLNKFDYLAAYYYSCVAGFLFFFRCRDKRDSLQAYVAFDWFIVFAAIVAIRDGVGTVYFANHYDRWAVLFDSLFEGKNIILLQHGVLPEKINLPYRLRNVRKIYVFDERSKGLFDRICVAQNVDYELLDISLPLKDLNVGRRTVLIIGFPYVMDLEVEVAQALAAFFKVLIKPHPLYDSSGYRRAQDATLIESRDFFPRVDVAVCYSSTLGLEYEASGIRVVWWQDKKVSEIVEMVRDNCDVSK